MEKGMLPLRFVCVWFAAFFLAVNTGETATDLGCFISQPGLRIAHIRQEVPKGTLTPAECVKNCERKRLPYAGLENGDECYCGIQIPALQSKTLPKECNANCSGNGNQTCGGKERMNIFRISSVSLTDLHIASPIYIGCYKSSSPENKPLFNGITNAVDNLSPAACHPKCYEAGSLYFALSNSCVCGDKPINIKYKVSDSVCSDVCPGDKEKKCGSAGHLSLYTTGITDFPITPNYLIGCYNEQFSSRMMSRYVMSLQNTNAPRRCVNICMQRGYLYAAVRYQFCYCNDEIPKENAIEIYSGCTQNKCAGDEMETCGGADRLKIFYTTNLVETKKVYQDYYGCFADDVRHSMMGDSQRTFTEEIFSDDCSELCKLRGYAFAGTAKNNCYCEHNIPPTSSKLTGVDCDSPCFNQSPFPCGDRTPLLTHTSGLPILDTPNSVYIGCFRESSNQQNISHTRLLNGYFNFYPHLTPQLCHKMCFREGHLYYGLSGGGTCYCGDAAPDPDSLANDVECQTNCEGDANYKCGGILRTAIFATGIANMPTLNRYVGCYQDEGSGVVLPELKMELSRTNSPRRCLNLCTVLGFTYAGVHSKRFCQCGNTKPPVTLVREAGSCALQKCVGDRVETCGGPDGITKVFRTKLSDQDRVGGYVGCYTDQSVNRLLPDMKEVFTESLVPNYCSSICSHRGFAFAGLSKGTECYCGYYSPSLISKANENECSSPCSGNREVFCGGKQQLSIYYTGVQTMDIEARVYLGCFKEEAAGRSNVFFEKRLLNGFWITMDATVEQCHVACYREGFLYFGLTERYYCFCGDNKPTMKVKENDCFHSCKGDVNEKCGAESRFNVYHTGITDFDTVGKYLGCYKDSTGIQLLRGPSLQLPDTNSPKRCSNICASKGFTYFGLRIGMECHCGNDSPSNSKLATNSSDCDNKKCPGNTNETCGSRRSIKIYQLRKPALSRACDPRYEDCDSSRPYTATQYPIIEELTTASTTETPYTHHTTLTVSVTAPITPVTEATAKTCTFPPVSAGRTCSVNCHGSTECSKPGGHIPAYADLTCSCSPGYALSTETSLAYCINGIWFPNLPECVRLCPALKSPSLQFLSCDYEGANVPCNEPAKPDTTVRIACKPTYTPEDPSLVVRSVTCLPGGNWDQPLYKCRPGCGEGFPGSLSLLVDGNASKPNDMPWHVAIYRKKNPTTGQEHQYICGGTIMSPALIISAAHCFYDRVTNKRLPAEQYEIAVAKYTIEFNKTDDSQTAVFNVAKIHIPDGFYGEELYYVYDIALLELDGMITMSSKLMPICIDWSPTDSKPPERGMVAGWGLTESGKPSDVLLVASLPFITQQECRAMVEEEFRRYVSQPDKFCSGSKTGAGARQGDSGGGWMYKKDGHYFIYGIVSFKERRESSLATFTRISSHLDWLDKIRKEILHTRGL